MCVDVENPIFQYRCAEYAYQNGDYIVAKKCYFSVLKRCYNFSHLGMLAACGALDSFFNLGDWLSADKFINTHDFSIFRNFFGYDSLLIRECFLLIKKNHFQAAKNLLLIIDFVHLDRENSIWYHVLYALILFHDGHVQDAKIEFNVAKQYCFNGEQFAVIEAFQSQSEVKNFSTNTNVDTMAKCLEEKINGYNFGKQALPFFKQYILLLRNAEKDSSIVNNLIDALSSNIECDDDLYEIILYRAIYFGILSESRKNDIETILLKCASNRIKLLTFKLLTRTVSSKEDAKVAFEILDNVLRQSSSDWLNRNIFLAKIAILISVKELNFCQNVANEYVKTFSRDKYFDELYELLAYLAVDEHIAEYRLSAHYLDKLRTLSSDLNIRAVITLKIADAFFYNHDFKLASEIYDEVLTLDRTGKFQDVIENQVLSDLFLQDFERAKEHLSQISGYPPKKCEAIIQYLSALKENQLHIEALKYIDSIDLDEVPKLFKLRLILYKSKILYANKQYAQAMLFASKVCNLLTSRNIPINNENLVDIISNALFIKGCSALSLQDAKLADETFKQLRISFEQTKWSSLSFIKEAKFFSKLGNYDKAISLLQKCKDDKYIPYAQYKIAEIMCAMGRFTEALKLFEDIVQNYRDSEFKNLARIAEGDTLRMLGKFADAQIIYERMLGKVNDEEQVKYLSLARAKCLLAQNCRNSSALDRAIIALEKLYASHCQDIALWTEIVSEYCLALKLKNNYGMLQTIALTTLKNISKNERPLPKNAIHWVLQILFLLRDSCCEISIDRCDAEYVDGMIKQYQNFLIND